jgi:prolyl-tRNA synthetase
VVLAVRTEEGAGEAASALADQLRAAGVRVELDLRTDLSFGRRVVNWELKGVPVRLEVGPRDLAAGTAVLSRRDDTSKVSIPLDSVVVSVTDVLESSQAALFAEALRRREENTVRVLTIEDAEEAAQSGFAVMPGAVLAAGDGEGRLNAGGITVRLLQRPDGSLPGPNDDLTELDAVVGRAY